jgi:flagellar export protein FliJ
MAFQFTLQALLRFRNVQERRERMRLATLNATRGRLRNELEEAWRQGVAEFEQHERRLETGMPAAELRLERFSLQLTKEHQHTLSALLDALELQVRNQIEAYSEAQKRRKTLESIRDRQWQVHQLTENRREQQRIDDLFAQRLARQAPKGQ